MDRAQIASLFAAFALAALALHAALRITEPRGRTPTHGELASAQQELDASYQRALEKSTLTLERAEKNVKEGDFATHLKWAIAYSAVLRLQTLKKTKGKVGQPEPDQELLRLLDLCRECVRNDRHAAELRRFEMGRVWPRADPEN